MSSALEPGSDAIDPELLAYADAVLNGSPTDRAAAQEALRTSRGDAAVVDAAGVIANFSQMNRIADAAGIALDAPTQMFAEQLIDDGGYRNFASAENTEPIGTAKRIAGRGLRRVAPTALRAQSAIAARFKRSRD
ncbi:MAG: hypothetical protein AAFY28_02040 [Actinomycetota bacterium]